MGFSTGSVVFLIIFVIVVTLVLFLAATWHLARANNGVTGDFSDRDFGALVDAAEAAISVGPMDPIHSEDRHSWGQAWHFEPPPEPRADHIFLQGRRACARRAVEAVLARQKELSAERIGIPSRFRGSRKKRPNEVRSKTV